MDEAMLVLYYCRATWDFSATHHVASPTTL